MNIYRWQADVLTGPYIGNHQLTILDKETDRPNGRQRKRGTRYPLPASWNSDPLALNARRVIDDAKLQDMVRQDISVILIRAPALKPALVAGYRSALPQGTLFAERVISEIDPGYLGVVRAGCP